MKCAECGLENKIDEVNILIYRKPICNNCADDRSNMRLAKETQERFELSRKVNA